MDLNKTVDMVLKKLSIPRIGVLWHSRSRWEGDCGFVDWVHYVDGGPGPADPWYDLNSMDRPENEGYSLDGLMVLSAPPSLLRELVTFPETSGGRLIAGCLGRNLPVVLDVSSLRGWSAWQGPMGERLARAMSDLTFLGCSLVGWGADSVKDSGLTDKRDEGVALSDPGWYSWSEIASSVRPGAVLHLGSGVKLTDQAKDRLSAIGVTLEVSRRC
ncbi:MAG: hypothetical protein U9Q00_07920 [Synergistota bacterium]|jgi:hypothetical protein|nr:hypothetical protein [Synergistota bacterium]